MTDTPSNIPVLTASDQAELLDSGRAFVRFLLQHAPTLDSTAWAHLSRTVPTAEELAEAKQDPDYEDQGPDAFPVRLMFLTEDGQPIQTPRGGEPLRDLDRATMDGADNLFPMRSFELWVRLSNDAVVCTAPTTPFGDMPPGDGILLRAYRSNLRCFSKLSHGSKVFPAAGGLNRMQLLRAYGSEVVEACQVLPPGMTTYTVEGSLGIFTHEEAGVIGVVGV